RRKADDVAWSRQHPLILFLRTRQHRLGLHRFPTRARRPHCSSLCRFIRQGRACGGSSGALGRKWLRTNSLAPRKPPNPGTLPFPIRRARRRLRKASLLPRCIARTFASLCSRCPRRFPRIWGPRPGEKNHPRQSPPHQARGAQAARMKAAMILQTAEAFVLTALLMPLLIRLANRCQVLDFPGRLKIHARPIPRLGGVAVALALVSIPFLYHPLEIRAELPFVVSLVLIWASGLLDDIRGLSPIPRLAAQIVAATLLWTAGWRVPVPLGAAPSLILTSLFVIFFVNAFNFLDGADGVSAGVAGIIAIAYAIFPGAAGNPFSSGVAFSLAGACAGFLLFNFPPAKIFLGDCGSNVLGFVVAFLALDFWRSQPVAVTVPALLFPFLLCALPLLDAALAIIRRLRLLTSPLAGD